MKLETGVDTTKVESNMMFEETVEMGFTMNSMHLMSTLLTKIYNDPEAAVFREYWANGWDAHVAVGLDRPVDVYLPTEESPYLQVTDYGIGMSLEDVKTVLAFYGESTKNESNEDIGGFGLGFKSGLAIASQFTVKTTKDGITTLAIVQRSDAGAPKLQVVSSTETGDESGTTVSIPLAYSYNFDKKVEKYLYFMPETMVNIVDSDTGINHKYYNHDNSEGYSAGEGVSVFFKDPYSNYNISTGIYVVMGGVYYEISADTLKSNLTLENKKYADVFDRFISIIEIPIGSVELSPNREGVQFDDRTINFFNEIIGNLYSIITEDISKTIESGEDYTSVMKKYEGLRKFNIGDLYWNGIDISKSLIVNAPDVTRVESTGNVSVNLEYSDQYNKSFRPDVDERVRYLFITGTTRKEISRYLRTYLFDVVGSREYTRIYLVNSSDEDSKVFSVDYWDNMYSYRYSLGKLDIELTVSEFADFLTKDSDRVKIVDGPSVIEEVKEYRKAHRVKAPRKPRPKVFETITRYDTAREDAILFTDTWASFSYDFKGRDIVLLRSNVDTEFITIYNQFSNQTKTNSLGLMDIVKELYPNHVIVKDPSKRLFKTSEKDFEGVANSVVEFDYKAVVKKITYNLNSIKESDMSNNYLTRQISGTYKSFLRELAKNNVDKSKIKDANLRRVYQAVNSRSDGDVDFVEAYRCFVGSLPEKFSEKYKRATKKVEHLVDYGDKYHILNLYYSTSWEYLLHMVNAEYAYHKKSA